MLFYRIILEKQYARTKIIFWDLRVGFQILKAERT